MANKKLYCEDVLQMLFADSDSEGNICLLEMTISRLMIVLLPVHLCSAMVPPCKVRVFTKHKQVIISTLCPTGMREAGVNVVVVSIGELLLIAHTLRVQVQSVWDRSVHCAMQ